jgi:hypothetical protein
VASLRGTASALGDLGVRGVGGWGDLGSSRRRNGRQDRSRHMALAELVDLDEWLSDSPEPVGVSRCFFLCIWASSP